MMWYTTYLIIMHPINKIIAPLTSSTTAFHDFGIVYNHSIVLRIEIQSSPMHNAVAKLCLLQEYTRQVCLQGDH